MLYPGEDEPDRRKAKAFAAQYLAKPIRHFLESGGTLSIEVLTQIATESGERLDDLEKRWWGGTATGQLFKTFLILAKTNEKLASWNNAIKVVTHDKYSFYNPQLHPGFTPADSPILLFEATYTRLFSKTTDPTPRHDYNQVLYRLDLDQL